MSASVMKIGDLCEQIRGVTYSKDESSRVPKDGYVPVLRANNITEQGLCFDDLVYVPKSRVAARQYVRENDVVVAASSGSIEVVGKAARAVGNFNGGFGAFCKVLRPNEKVHPAYFSHYFRTIEYRRRVSSLAEGANINNLRNEHIDEIEIKVPTLGEQRRIAAILDKADALRVNHREVAAKFDQLLQSVFVEMFGDPASNPKRWPKSVLGELASIQTGSTPPTSSSGFFEGPIPFVTPGDLGSLVRNSRRTLSMEGALKSRTVPAGSTLVCCIGATIGKVGLAMRKCAFNQQINAVTWHDRVDSIYGYYLLYFLSGEIARRGSSTTLPIINKGDFEKIEVIVPPMDLQKVFSEIAISIQNQSEVVSLADAKCQEIFRSIQNQFFAVRDDCAR